MVYYANFFNDGYIMHFGKPKRSGRYPWGSGKNPYHHGTSNQNGQKKRRASDMTEEELSSKIKRKTLENTYNNLYPQKDKLSSAKKTLDAAQDIVNQSKKFIPENKHEKKRMDLSKMTDKELRDRINRELLERQYTSMFGEEKREAKGRAYAREILEITGATLGIATSAIVIAKGIKELRG